MNILQSLVQLRDDIKVWVTNNVNTLYAKIEEKAISVDSELDATSTNPVQNKVIASEINDINSRVGTTSVSTRISTHNTATDAHNDMRLLIEGLATRLNALADSDDTTLDQMSEIVAYIKSNKTLIEDVTTNKVNVVDIIDNLITNVANKPLSAAQGVALKALIDTLDQDKLSTSVLTVAVAEALAQAKASGEFDGANGDTPVRGVDYWTEADKAEIKSYVDDAILGGEW